MISKEEYPVRFYDFLYYDKRLKEYYKVLYQKFLQKLTKITCFSFTSVTQTNSVLKLSRVTSEEGSYFASKYKNTCSPQSHRMVVVTSKVKCVFLPRKINLEIP
jgi:hypothetical protein